MVLAEKEGRRREYEIKRRDFALRTFQLHSQMIFRVITLVLGGNLAGAAFVFNVVKGTKPGFGFVLAMAGGAV